MKKEIGLLGGTFDPIHFGHINLAIQLLEVCRLDEIIFCPNNISPFKIETPPIASPQERLNMVNLAIEGASFFSSINYEVNKMGASYTIDTIKFLYEQREDLSLRLILTEEAIMGLELWKDIEEILKLAPPIIGKRKNSFGFIDHLPPKYTEIIKSNMIETKQMDISSTDLRERLKKNLYCSHLIPAKVLDYICNNQLYLSR